MILRFQLEIPKRSSHVHNNPSALFFPNAIWKCKVPPKGICRIMALGRINTNNILQRGDHVGVFPEFVCNV